MKTMGAAARAAAETLHATPAQQRSEAIRVIAANIRRRSQKILVANAQDVADATSLVDRLLLNEERLEAMARSVEEIADLPDPVGEVMERWTRPNGLEISRVRTPIGVIGMIYESRPNVTADAAAICLRSGNAVILRSGSEALAELRWRSARRSLTDLRKSAFPPEACRSFRRRIATRSAYCSKGWTDRST